MNPIFTYVYFYPLLIILLITILVIFLFLFDKATIISFSINEFDIILIVFGIYFILDKLYFSPIKLGLFDFCPLILYFYLYVLLRIYISKRIGIIEKSLFLLIILLGLIDAAIGLVQGVMDNNQHSMFMVTGSFINPSVYSNYLLSVLSCSILYLLIKSPLKFYNFKWYNILALFTSIFIIIIIYVFVNERTSWLGVILIALYFYFIKTNGKYPLKHLKKKVSKYIIMMLIIFTFGFILSLLFLVKRDSTMGRLFVIENSITILKDNFIEGIGFGNFDKYYNKFQGYYFSNHIYSNYKFFASYIKTAYNEYLQIFIEGGIIAITLIIYLLYKIFIIITRNDIFGNNTLKFGISICLITLFIAFFSYPFRTSPTITNFIIGLAIISAFDKNNIIKYHINSKLLYMLLLFLSLIIIKSSLIIYGDIKLWTRASLPANNGNYEMYENTYKSLFPDLKNNLQYLMDYGNNLYLDGKYRNSIRILNIAKKQFGYYKIYVTLGSNYEKLGNIDSAKYYYSKASYMVPNRYYPRYRLMNLYYKNNNILEANKWATIILKMPIKVKSPLIDKIKVKARYILNK